MRMLTRELQSMCRSDTSAGKMDPIKNKCRSQRNDGLAEQSQHVKYLLYTNKQSMSGCIPNKTLQGHRSLI